MNDFLNQIGDFLLPSSEVLADVSDPSGGPLCQAQSWMESFFEISSPMWTTAIAATLYMSVIQRRSSDAIEGSFKYMVLVCVGLPLLLTVIPGALGYYGVAGAWCWIAEAHSEWRLYQFFLPLLACILFNGFVYFRVVCAIRETVRATEEGSGGARDPAAQQMRLVVGRLLRYPLILVIVWFFAMVNRATEAASGQSIFWLYLLQKLFSSSQGFLNALAYGFSAGVQEAVSADIALLCPCLVGGGGAEPLPSPAGPRGFRGGGGGAGAGAGQSRLERDLSRMDSGPSIGGAHSGGAGAGGGAGDLDAYGRDGTSSSGDLVGAYGVEIAYDDESQLELGAAAVSGVTVNPVAGMPAGSASAGARRDGTTVPSMEERVRAASGDSGV